MNLEHTLASLGPLASVDRTTVAPTTSRNPRQFRYFYGPHPLQPNGT
jgi:hypothetical protein